MRIAIALLMALHATVHLIGFAAAYKLGPSITFRQPISRAWGRAWLLVACAWGTTAVLYAAQIDTFWVVGAPASLASFVLVARNYYEAKWGLLPNLILTFFVVFPLVSRLVGTAPEASSDAHPPSQSSPP